MTMEKAIEDRMSRDGLTRRRTTKIMTKTMTVISPARR